MRTSVVFVVGLLLGATIATGFAQGTPRLPGDNYMNHVSIVVEDMNAALAFYTQKMGFPEAFVIRDDKGQPTLAYLHVSRNTFIELNPANANRRPGLNHFGLHVQDLKAVQARLKAQGVTIEDVRVRPDDSSVANATDPSGIRIELFQFGPGSAQGKAIAAYK